MKARQTGRCCICCDVYLVSVCRAANNYTISTDHGIDLHILFGEVKVPSIGRPASAPGALVGVTHWSISCLRPPPPPHQPGAASHYWPLASHRSLDLSSVLRVILQRRGNGEHSAEPHHLKKAEILRSPNRAPSTP